MGYAKISRPRVQFSFPIVGFPSLASRRIEPQSTTQGCIARRALLRPQRPWTLASNPHARAVCQPRPELTSMPSRLPTPPLPAYRPRLPSGLIRFRLIALPLPGRPHPRPHHSHSRSRSHVRTILHSFSQCHAPPPLICPRPSLALGRPISRASYGAEAALYHVQQLPRTRRQRRVRTKPFLDHRCTKTTCFRPIPIQKIDYEGCTVRCCTPHLIDHPSSTLSF